MQHDVAQQIDVIDVSILGGPVIAILGSRGFTEELSGSERALPCVPPGTFSTRMRNEAPHCLHAFIRVKFSQKHDSVL